MKIIINISNRQRASLVGILILVAYSMLTYAITKNITLGVITDIISGFAVIGIPLLMLPIFSTYENKRINYAYLVSRFIEGILMIVGGIIILNPSLEIYREIIYRDIQIFFLFLEPCFFTFYYIVHKLFQSSSQYGELLQH